MPHEELSWITNDGANLYGQEWTCTGHPKGVITLVHGLGEHSGRYHHVGNAFSDAGYYVDSFDLRGHGKSGGKRGHGSYDQYLLDIESVLMSASQRHPGIPQFLYGHSLGGSLVIYYLLRRDPKLKGAIASASGFGPGYPVPPIKILAGRIMSRISPLTIFTNGLPQSGLSHDESVAPKYLKDPLVHDRISARLGVDLLDIGPWEILNAHKINVPLLLVYGSEDHVISTQKIKDFITRAGDCITVKVWDGMYHEVHNEIGKELVLADMITWCDRLISPSPLS